MHELSVCQAMLTQVEEIARRENARDVTRIVVRIGPLAGVVPDLLQQAFTVARAGTIAAEAELVTEEQPIRVSCLSCGAESDVLPNRLLCKSCGDYRTRVISGDELLLASVELNRLSDERLHRPA
ncbi:MAG: hydrogenase maturation nickel metallochaperone HypA [Candidatus Thiodiazotropha sp. (ex Semelilucina semeliformis)]|nr:hydrogenase maturation nickel metallochaperone HypA [Candidatus Thiodiazotropha sp. (ex Myrtea spinifera)]MCU7808210.1 hydrogenase maturation nickel metallochaperone HypA [Candidatus Thiodiazotropha sp. (ex Semelilucina semeliformis)]MCU7830990.1 hydrogenase maturation nickel metallochaperone HypA [Candidatus Thiodiazotropha sp. (ex Myrtea sp. 'scaly one' KF741663)]